MESLSREALHLIAGTLKLLASPTRLAILQHICHGEQSVGRLVELTGFKQANVSRQLSLLHRGGIVRRRTDGNSVYYTAADETLPKLCELMRESVMARQDEMLAALGDA